MRHCGDHGQVRRRLNNVMDNEMRQSELDDLRYRLVTPPRIIIGGTRVNAVS